MSEQTIDPIPATTDRLVPYRPLDRVYADGTITAAMAAIGALGARMVAPPSDLVAMLAIGGAMILAAFLSVPLADWRARRRGAELIPRSEHYRRTLIERAERPIWEAVWSTALVAGFVATTLSLALFPIEEWRIVPSFAAVGLALGGINGAYLYRYSRTAAIALEGAAGKSSDTTRQPASPTPFRVQAMRHYAGYALGLAAGLFACTNFVDPTMSVGALFVGFVVGKVASDSLLPSVYYGVSPPAPTVARFLRGICLRSSGGGCRSARCWRSRPTSQPAMRMLSTI